MTIYVVDVILVILLVIGAVRGFMKGFIAQLFSLAALLLGIWGAIRFSDFTATLLMEQFNFNNQYLPLISFAITFLECPVFGLRIAWQKMLSRELIIW